MYKGVAGIDEINRQMQVLFNPKSPQKNQMKVGTTIFRENDKVILLKNLPDDDVYVGRSYMDAPDVDGFVFLSTSWHLVTGDYVRVQIVQAQGYDLIGEVIEEDDDEFTK